MIQVTPTFAMINPKPALTKFVIRLALLIWLGAMPTLATAVVCAFTNHAPRGEHMVGHATEWIAADEAGPTRQIQWWYPTVDQELPAEGRHSYGDYQQELLQTGPVPEGERDPAVLQRQREIAEIAIRRGSPSVRYSHTRAAAMLAFRGVSAKAGNWPVIWLAGDPSFADLLASHGFIVVSTPAVYGTEPDLEQQIFAAQAGIDATRKRFGLQLKSITSVGFNAQALLAARVSGLFPQSSGLALIGEWKALDARDPRRDASHWFDPSELRVPTLYISAGDNYTPLKAHPLGSPFSSTNRMHFGGMDGVHLEFGMPESCAPNWIVGRRVKPLTLVQAQYALRLELAQFVAARAGVEIKPAPLELLPIDVQRKEPLEIHRESLPAQLQPPPALERVARLLSEGGVNALVGAMPESTRQRAPTVWWELALLQLYVSEDPEQPRALIDAWQKAQPNSLAAAVLRASANPESKDLWKRARSLARKDLSLAPARRRELMTAIEAAFAH